MVSNVNERVRQHRQNMKAAGMRQVHIWVPDTRSKSFAQECAKQSRAIKGDSASSDVQNWAEKIADTEDWV